MKTKFKKDDWVSFLPEWQDEGDDEIGFRCIEDEDGGRVKVMACIGAPINPIFLVDSYMIEKQEEI